MLIKAGVDISRLNRNARRSLPIVAAVFKAFGEELVLTSTYEGTHGDGSLHYSDDAYDVRKPSVPSGTLEMQLKPALGTDFDMVLEWDHIHIEYDPK